MQEEVGAGDVEHLGFANVRVVCGEERGVHEMRPAHGGWWLLPHGSSTGDQARRGAVVVRENKEGRAVALMPERWARGSKPLEGYGAGSK